MTLLVVGATDRAIASIRQAAKQHAIAVAVGDLQSRPDWALVADAEQRATAIRRYGLPPHRVIELPQLASQAGLSPGDLRPGLRRMKEIGACPRQTSRFGRWIAQRMRPVVMERSAWLAASEIRERIAARANTAQDEPATGTPDVLFVLPDASAIAVVGGLTRQLLRDGCHVQAVFERGGTPAELALLQDVDRDLEIASVPHTEPSLWHPLARAVRGALTAWRISKENDTTRLDTGVGHSHPSRLACAIAENSLARFAAVRRPLSWVLASLEHALPPDLEALALLDKMRPSVVVVAPFGPLDAPHVDVVRAARAIGIPTVCFPLAWDDVSTAGLRFEPPDVAILWNHTQQHSVTAIDRVPEDRVAVAGALLPSDLADVGVEHERLAYCARLDIDPERRIILYAAPGPTGPADLAHFQAWLGSIQASDATAVREAVVVLYVDGLDESMAWRRLAKGLGARIDRGGVEPQRQASRLRDGIAAADVVVTGHVTAALEAARLARPVLSVLDESGGGFTRFARSCPTQPDWPRLAQALPEHVEQLRAALEHGLPAATLRQAAEIVLPTSDHAPAIPTMSRLIRDLATRETGRAVLRPKAIWRRGFFYICAALARRVDPVLTTATVIAPLSREGESDADAPVPRTRPVPE